MLVLKENYYDKQEFVKDFIRFCREVKERSKRCSPWNKTYICKFVGVCGESWKFEITASADGIWTQADLLQSGERAVHFPRTKWGEPGVRWDSDLRKFLIREVNKA